MSNDLQSTMRILVKLSKSIIYNRVMMLSTHNVTEGSYLRQKCLKKYIKQDADCYLRDLDLLPRLKKGRHEYCFCYRFTKELLKSYLVAVKVNANSFSVKYVSEFHHELLDPFTYRNILLSYADEIFRSVRFKYIEYCHTDGTLQDKDLETFYFIVDR